MIHSVVYQDACFILPGQFSIQPCSYPVPVPPSTTSLAPTISAIIHRKPPTLFHTPNTIDFYQKGGGFCFGRFCVGRGRQLWRVPSTTGLKVEGDAFGKGGGVRWEGPRWPRAATRNASRSSCIGMTVSIATKSVVSAGVHHH